MVLWRKPVMTAKPSSNPSGTEQRHDNRNCGLYLHIPFCLRKCLYCSFFSVPSREAQTARYCRALIRQKELLDRLDWTGGCTIKTVFFGGGTPTVLPVDKLIALLEAFCRSFPIRQDHAEISLEANPATVTQKELAGLFMAGFNRLSIGVQSFADEELQLLGRPHTAEEARSSFIMARKAGFTNISMDLMYGLPGQSIASWGETLRQALALEPDHLSIYELGIEPGTVFAGLREQGKLTLPEESEVLEMMAMALEQTAGKGLQRYEISNYAMPGKECRHNLNYWENGSYWGLGAGGVSSLAGRRFAGIEDIDKFCRQVEAGDPAIGEIEILEHEARFRETVIMGLRMTRGISVAGLELRFGINVHEYYGDLIYRLQQDGMVEADDDIVRLTGKGLVFANRVMAELV